MGLIGLLTSRILNAKLVVEINGVHTSSSVYIDDKNTRARNIKQAVYRYVEAFVLRFSDGARILFPTQLNTFKKIVANKIIEQIPAFVDIGPFVSLPVQDDSKEILFVGFPLLCKGVDILVEAFKSLSPKHPEWSLKIMGWFPERHETARAPYGRPSAYCISQAGLL